MLRSIEHIRTNGQTDRQTETFTIGITRFRIQQYVEIIKKESEREIMHDALTLLRTFGVFSDPSDLFWSRSQVLEG